MDVEKVAEKKVENNNADSLDPNEEKFCLLFGKYIKIFINSEVNERKFSDEKYL